MADFDIFNLGVDDVDTHKQAASTGSNDLYKPDAEQGKDGTYKALIRFVPNPANPRNSLIKKYVHWLKDAGGEGKLVDSPSSIGDKCPIADAFFKLRKSDSAVDRKMSEQLKRREQYYALVKIIKDPQFPEFEGTYKIFKFGYKIKEKIDEELKPAFGEPTQVFDLFEGKNFELIITRQNDYNNYDKSKFSPSKSAILVDGAPAEKTKENMTVIKTELDKAPLLEPYEYKAWDDQTRDFVNSILRQYLNPGSAMDDIVNKQRAQKPAPVKEAAAAVSSGNADIDSFELGTPTESGLSGSSAKDEGDDLDAFLNDLDLG